ncbi:fimbria/pilus periplasmic chaperone [Erwinia sp. SLM-02]|uniref:fimbria/pilus periplasmic chaperone n=1 Tax=Erwinia sp. SLM-02 TaxID=3020057 RepID=UPI00308039C7
MAFWQTAGRLCLTGMVLVSTGAQAAIALDRTRVIVDAGNPSVSLAVANENPRLPYLAQAWIEDERHNKVTTPLITLPPVQRIEPGEKSQLKIQVLPAINLLAQDKETLFYFNLREIPPRSDKPNTLQIALQTRIKLFFRPAALKISPSGYQSPVQKQLTLTREGERYRLNNPTGYYVTIVEASGLVGGPPIKGFESVMVAPRAGERLSASVAQLGNTPVLKYINDFGGRSTLTFHCESATCRVTDVLNKG